MSAYLDIPNEKVCVAAHLYVRGFATLKFSYY